ncbi:MAG: NAD(P)/FAD-dependent oxidoreductase [Thaumarchaeota archaeon]|nr:NAD(P)/FAD-dependent oxidoreductase [Nitrososphaerota archaeon]
MSAQFDAIVIGAGHNGLACAGYLAKSGMKVLVLERRNIVGGACTTEELIKDAPGFKSNICATDHIFIHLNPVIQDLQLKSFGLDYIDIDPMFFIPFPDGKHLFLYRDVDKTAKEIEKLSPKDAKTYSKFAKDWIAAAETLAPAFFAPPIPVENLTELLYKAGDGEFARNLMTSVKQMVDENFETDYVKGPVSWLGCQTGFSPTDPGTGFIAGLFMAIHQVGLKRPRGGSGMLPIALARAVEHFGGVIRTDAQVKRILVRNGQTYGVELVGGEQIIAKTVVSNADPKTTLLKLVEPQHLDDEFRRKVERIKVTAYKLKVDCAVKNLPDYISYPGKNIQPNHKASQLICPSADYLEEAYHDAALNEHLSSKPAMWVATQSAADPSLAPPDNHTLYMWAAYFTVEQPKKKSLQELKEEAAGRALDTLAEYAPNISDSIIAMETKSHADLEQMLALPKGNSMHVDPSLNQMFSLRPLPGWANYRTPIKKLYLTGAGTHPFGGVNAIPGYNTAHVVIRDWSRGS